MNRAVRQPTLFDSGTDRALRFWRFHEAHPEVYAELLALARQARARGRHRIGIRMLWERMRWTFTVERDRAELYKLNDHYTAFYARLLLEEPGLEGLFETRER